MYRYSYKIRTTEEYSFACNTQYLDSDSIYMHRRCEAFRLVVAECERAGSAPPRRVGRLSSVIPTGNGAPATPKPHRSARGRHTSLQTAAAQACVTPSRLPCIRQQGIAHDRSSAQASTLWN
jgi:hypothetical protein